MVGNIEPTDGIEASVGAYSRAYLESDPQRRAQLVTAGVAEHVSILGERGEVSGRDALLAYLDRLHADANYGGVRSTSQITHHHGWFRFTAAFYDRQGVATEHVEDVGHIDSEGKIDLILVFPASNDA